MVLIILYNCHWQTHCSMVVMFVVVFVKEMLVCSGSAVGTNGSEVVNCSIFVSVGAVGAGKW